MRAPTFPHRWVMHVWSNGTSPWHTRNDHAFQSRYGEDLAVTSNRRECTPEELAEIEVEYSQWGNQ